MIFHWRQAITSALVGGAAAGVASLFLHGTMTSERLAFVVVIALAVGASRLIELRQR